MTEVEDTSWLEVEDNDTGWLDIEDPNAGRTTSAFRHLIDACMRGTNRVMACDGHYLAYRPFNREFDKETNPRTRERFADFEAAGHFEHKGTYDEVQIYELLPGSPFRHEKTYVIGQSYWGDIRQAAKAACERNWSDYHDILGGMATALKGGGRDPGFAKTMWDDTVNQVGILIGQMKGPPEREVNEGFMEIRRKRGIAKGTSIATLNSAGLVKVGFSK